MGWFSKLGSGEGSSREDHDFEGDLEELRSRKKDDSYHFTYDFTYIEKRLRNDEYEDGTATMECDVVWDEGDAGYRISYTVPDMYKIDAAEGNGSADEFYEHDVYWRLMADLDAMGIDSSLRSI